MTSKADRVVFQHTTALNTDTASSPLTFTSPQVAAPQSVDGSVVPVISNVKKVECLPFEIAGVPIPQDSARLAPLSFSMHNIAPPTANMLRRLILTEVPTMAFDRVLIHANDGVVLDELLSHRLGMCPIAADPAAFEYITENNFTWETAAATHVLKFELDVTASRDPAAAPITPVYSGDLKWVPMAGQEAMNVRLVQDDILLAKLGRGQRIKLEAYAIKGLGLVHAKWAPVAACWYDLATEVALTEPIVGAAAKELKALCPMGVFDVETVDGKQQARVKKAGKCTLCRECIRPPAQTGSTDFSTKVTVSKNKTALTFTVESLGQYDAPEDVVRAALTLFAERCRSLQANVKECDVVQPLAQ
jgi:DNA-directed RNA polymerase alpha subunit